MLVGPENEYFLETAKKGLGLDSAPQCLKSASAADQASCRASVAEGLTDLAKKLTLGNMVPQTGLGRTMSLSSLHYVKSSAQFEQMIKEVQSGFGKQFADPAQARKLEFEIFPKVKELILKRLRSMPISEEKRQFMISKVSNIRFGGTDCSDLAGGDRSLPTTVLPNAFYSPNKNSFNFCSGFFVQSSSEFNAVFTIAHELAHSIDPCGITQGALGMEYKNTDDYRKAEAEYPIPGVINCLRSKDSIRAGSIYRDAMEMYSKSSPGSSGTAGPQPSGMPTIPPGGGYGTGGYGSGVGYGMAYPGSKPPKLKVNFCEGDQIGESFSDWLATEVTPDYMEQNHKLTPAQYATGYSNTFRAICRYNEETQFSSQMLNPSTGQKHPQQQDRMNKIIIANPKVRKQMGCSTDTGKAKYCEAKEGVEATETDAVNSTPARTLTPPPIKSGSGAAR